MMPKNDVLAPCSATARLRLVATANMRLTVRTAAKCAPGLVFLRQLLLAHLVAVIGYLASLGSLFVARVLLGFHVGFLKGWGQVWPSPSEPANFIVKTPKAQICQTAPRSGRRESDGG